MAANNNIQITDLDFDTIKNNLRTFLKAQDSFKDYNFEGSALSNLLDLLAYNTHYNAYYLNTVANEMFLDTAQLRSSVVSLAKMIGYTPRSSRSPMAKVNIQFTGAGNSAFTLEKNAKFQSEPVDGVNYTFVTTKDYTENPIGGTVTFTDVELRQGEPVKQTFVYDSLSNKSATFKLPDSRIDTSTIQVTVLQSSSSIESEVYTLAKNYSSLNGSSLVYFLQESLDNYYEIYFGDGIFGKKLVDGNVVIVDYLVTDGTSAFGANDFTFMSGVSSDYTGVTIDPLIPTSQGSEKETIESIKFTAPKTYAAQGRAVSKDDYISLIQNNELGYEFDSVSVWPGEENIPPVYGQIMISVKPKGSYVLTETQKQVFIDQVIKPSSVLTVQPVFVEPDYTYLQIEANITYNPRKTTLTASQLQTSIRNTIQEFCDNTLNKFDSVFSMTDLNIYVNQSNPSIIANECFVNVQKKIYPTLQVPKTYKLYYSTPLERGLYNSGINSTPSFQSYTTINDQVQFISDVYLEELPFASSGIESINVLNPGYNYTEVPTVSISGDGTGASAYAVIKNGYISEIVVDNPGEGYTQAVVTITRSPTDVSGMAGMAIAELKGRYGSLRSYYYNNGIKTILNTNAGIIDYQTGLIELTSFNPYDINDPLGKFTITAKSESTILYSDKNRLLTVDPMDPTAIIVKITAK